MSPRSGSGSVVRIGWRSAAVGSLVVAWAAGFVAYQLVYPGTVPGWADFWGSVAGAIGFTPPTWLGSSVAAIVVGGVIMFGLGRLTRRSAPSLA